MIEQHEWTRSKPLPVENTITLTAWKNLDGYMECDQDANFIISVDSRNLVFTIWKQNPDHEDFDYPAFQRSGDILHLATKQLAKFDRMNHVIDFLRKQIYPDRETEI
ncbi:MAG: hypothetical protein OXG88_01175 [Gammaproteobacteria bacterium]|nr:hypothetical protein [Gammaproteobacteria bacterium]